MRRAILLGCGAGLLAGPTALAFASGGYFDPARAWAGIAAWALLAAAVGATGARLPATPGARAALAGLVLLAGWVWLSTTWAPLAGPAGDDVERLVLYVGVLVLALVVLRAVPQLRAWAEPALALGALVVISYGLAGRLLPGIVHLHRTISAGGRLEQPLTYWNAMGALAGIGLVLAARVAGDDRRPLRMRAAAAAAAAPLGAGVYLSFSRGALAATGAGLLVLIALAPTWTQLRALAIAAEAAVLGAALASLSPAVESLSGSLGDREAQGAAVLAILVGIALLAAGMQAWAGRVEREGRTRTGALPAPGRGLALVLAVLVVGAPLAAAALEHGPAGEPAVGATAQRLRSAGSNRYAYWRVALDDLRHHPLRGGGTASFRVAWDRERRITQSVQDAHSLYLETGAELGLVGLALLALLFGGVAVSGRALHRAAPAAAAGPAAALVAWAVHAGLDWDWEMPALTLVALALAGALLAGAEAEAAPAAQRARHLGDQRALEA